MPAGMPTRFLLSLSDVTPQVKARLDIELLTQRVQRQAAELEATFSAIADGLIVYDAEGNIVQLNAEATPVERI